MAPHAEHRDWRPQGAARDLVMSAALTGAAALTVGHTAGFGVDYALKAMLVLAICAAWVWRGLAAGRWHPHVRFGPANRVTLARLCVAALLAALVGEALNPQAAWVIVAIATVAAAMDAIDGPLARRSGLASAFGARFDMETDAWFTLVLCALVLQLDKAGTWVLASGLMRYAFVGAASVWPGLAGPLPPRRRRQAVCVMQIAALIVCLCPIVLPPLSQALAAGSLALLAWSFAVDVRWLARARQRQEEN
jgi:phosphatidylglycerophosphate synthase